MRIDIYEYDEWECGFPCTPHGCCGHSTNTPVSITIDGIIFHVDEDQVSTEEGVKDTKKAVSKLMEIVNKH